MTEDTHPIDHPVSVEGRTSVDAGGAAAHAHADVAVRPIPDDALIILPVRNVVMFPGTVVERCTNVVTTAGGFEPRPPAFPSTSIARTR